MEKSLKIVYLVRPADGGIRTHLLTLLVGLDRIKYDPVVICTPDTPLAEDVAAMGITVIPLSISDGLNPFQDMMAALRLRTILRKVKPAILHIHSAKAGLVGRLAVMSKRRPKVVVTMHSYVFDERMGPGQRNLYAKIERYFSKFTDRYIAVSQALKDEMVTEMGLDADMISVIYNGVEFQNVKKTPHPDIRIGIVSRLAPQKGIEYLIRAAALVLSSRQDVVFQIVGDGPERPTLGSLRDSLGIREAVYFLGARKDVPELLSTFDLYVQTSTSEAFGFSILEALSQEIPVVATRVGGVPEIIDDERTGLLAETRNPRDIADKILLMLSDLSRATEMAQAGSADVRERFTFARMVQATQELYADLLTRRPAWAQRKKKARL